MHTRNISLALFLAVVLCAGSALPAWAQGASSTGTVAGAITDAQGAVVVGATVTLTDVGTNSARTANTNASGRYIFVDVPPGMYRVTVAKQGFATTKAENQEVTVGSALTLNLGLQVGGASVVVEVQSTGSELQTMNATVGQTLTATAIDNLPSIGRDVNTFVELQPGVSPNGSVAGATDDQNYFSLDGGNNTNDMDGNGSVYTSNSTNLGIGDPTGGAATGNGVLDSAPSGVMPTPADSVEEFKVNTAGQTADFNSSSGAEVKVVTKRGTNSYHGTAYEYYKDNNWASNTWQNNFLNYIPGGHVGLPSYHFSRYGGAIGGPLIPKEVAGGKTYFFFNYEGFSYPASQTIFRNVPSPALELGLLSDTSATNLGAIDYNLNNVPVTAPNGSIIPANYGCAPAMCDPLGLGLNPVVSAIWSKYEPASSGTCVQSGCDNANILPFTANLNTPIKSKFMVGRIDHDFSAKEHFFTSYRYYNLKYAGSEQVDIGGFVTGDTLGQPASQSSDPVQDWYFVAGLTSNITSNTTNDFHYSYLRNWWAWTRFGAPPQVPGMGAAVEIVEGQSQVADLTPINSNNQQIRRRFWDGHDNMLRDDLSMLHGNHLFQFGGYYQHNFDYHQRNDSGGTINAYPVYSLGDTTHGSLLDNTGFLPCSGVGNAGAVTTVGGNTCTSIAAGVLGVTSIASQMFARSGPQLSLLPPLSNAFDQSTIPYYNVYFSDTWHLKPSMTLTYGLGYALEMPPTEAQGKETILVDQSDTPVKALDYIAARNKAALAGQVYNPELGFALSGNVGSGTKYAYNPYYGEFSPRVAFAWSPSNTTGALANTVVRAGYGRTYGRTNGVYQVLVPLLGLGLEQPVACESNIAGGVVNNWACGASGQATWGGANAAWRVNTTPGTAGGPTIPLASLAGGATLPQPVFPGFNSPASASPESLDPSSRPDSIDSFNVTIQRQVSRKVTLEIGYIGRRITNEFAPMMLNAVPYNMTLGGQSFKQAYANVVTQYCGGVAGLAAGGCGGSNLYPTPGTGPNAGAVTPQPFFEAALGGASSAYCAPFAGSNPTGPCTAAVVANEGAAGTGNLTNAQVWSLWSDLDNGAFVFPRTMMNTPIASTCTGTTPPNNYGCSGQFTSTATLNGNYGSGNYNAGFVSVKMADWRGLTSGTNFTWSKALGLGAQTQSSSELDVLDPYNLKEMYGVQPFDRRIVFNSFLVYTPPFYKGQSGLIGRALGGWTFSGILTAGTGLPMQMLTTFADYQSFGACDGVACADYDSENAEPLPGAQTHSHAYAGHAGAQPYLNVNGQQYYVQTNQGQGAGQGYPVNEFARGTAEINYWRNPILGIDTRDGGYGALSGLDYWNMDFAIKKNIRVAESVSLELQGVFTNVFNHEQQLDNYPYIGFQPSFGALAGQIATGPRNVQVGARVRF